MRSNTFPFSIGPYRVIERLGQGAMAQVYRASDAAGRQVALKVLHSHLTDDEGFLVRFRREAEAAAQLDHPNIVRVFDYGHDNGLHYLAMDLVEGPSLRTWLHGRSEPLPTEQVVALVGTLADAVAYAHSRGVVHRDLKPANILLRGGRPDDPVLTDFGVARMVETTLTTAAGTTLGTPTYMAPEQGLGQAGDERSDIYALGIICYELLTGGPPFAAESPYALILRHIHTPPPALHAVRPDLPAPLAAAVMRALAKDPAERYPSAAAFAAALRQALIPTSRPRSARWLSALAGTGLLIVLGVAALWRVGWLPFVPEPSGSAVAAKPTPAVLVLQGGPAIADTWIDPDVPDHAAFDDGKVHLQGPSTPDRVLLRLTLPDWPPNTELLTATLSLYTVPWQAEANRYATVAVHRIVRDWEVTTATYETPWSKPGLAPQIDFEPTPFITMTLTNLLTAEGWLEMDITPLMRDWLAGQPNYGLALRMTDDSFGMAHLWVYTSEYEDPNLWPKLELVYQHERP